MYRFKVSFWYFKETGALKGLSVNESFRVCSYADALKAENEIRNRLEVMSFGIVAIPHEAVR